MKWKWIIEIMLLQAVEDDAINDGRDDDNPIGNDDKSPRFFRISSQRVYCWLIFFPSFSGSSFFFHPENVAKPNDFPSDFAR